MPPIPLLISAGEASGDMYAARLAVALQKRMDVALFGMGGPQMRAAGVDVITDYKEVSVVGITEILSHLPSLIRAMRRLLAEAQRRKPPFAILTDFPGFHLRLARKLRPLGVRNIYYICPQFWAWRPWRVRVVRRRFAQALCIFPFEEAFFGDARVPTRFIGHPLVGAVQATQTRGEFCLQHSLDPSQPIVAILPGQAFRTHSAYARDPRSLPAHSRTAPHPVCDCRGRPQQHQRATNRLECRTRGPCRRKSVI